MLAYLTLFCPRTRIVYPPIAKFPDNLTVEITLDEASLRIIDALQENAELSNAELAERVGLSSSPCWRRVAELKQHGVLRGSVALVDPLKLGLTVNVFVHVSLKQQDKASLERFTQAISRRPEVMECYLMSGEADFMLRVVIEDLAKYQTLLLECLTQIPGVASIRSSFALSQVKYTTALPTGHLREVPPKARR
ncbi:Lrp/AsnC family leucine-responsive transcriptional regulator [Paraburkholderia atlantica]